MTFLNMIFSTKTKSLLISLFLLSAALFITNIARSLIPLHLFLLSNVLLIFSLDNYSSWKRSSIINFLDITSSLIMIELIFFSFFLLLSLLTEGRISELLLFAFVSMIIALLKSNKTRKEIKDDNDSAFFILSFFFFSFFIMVFFVVF